jgi:hypothetical protein
VIEIKSLYGILLAIHEDKKKNSKGENNMNKRIAKTLMAAVAVAVLVLPGAVMA